MPRQLEHSTYHASEQGALHHRHLTKCYSQRAASAGGGRARTISSVSTVTFLATRRAAWRPAARARSGTWRPPAARGAPPGWPPGAPAPRTPPPPRRRARTCPGAARPPRPLRRSTRRLKGSKQDGSGVGKWGVASYAAAATPLLKVPRCGPAPTSLYTAMYAQFKRAARNPHLTGRPKAVTLARSPGSVSCPRTPQPPERA